MFNRDPEVVAADRYPFVFELPRQPPAASELWGRGVPSPRTIPNEPIRSSLLRLKGL